MLTLPNKIDCSIHGKDQEIVCIHPRLQMYICNLCYEEWPDPTITISNVSYDEDNQSNHATSSTITYTKEQYGR